MWKEGREDEGDLRGIFEKKNSLKNTEIEFTLQAEHHRKLETSQTSINPLREGYKIIYWLCFPFISDMLARMMGGLALVLPPRVSPSSQHG